MSYPTKYSRQFGFGSYQSAYPTASLPGHEVDTDLNAVQLSIDEIVEFLKLHARADGALLNGVVTLDSLSGEVIAAINAGDAGGVSASGIAFTPVGGIAATTVQAAIAELDSEKLAASSYTAADVLDKVKTVDGASSGLDADLLDGQHASAFALASHTHDAGSIANTAAGNISATTVQAAINELDSEKLAASAYTAADVLAKLVTVDGTGSGLDSDLLDGQHASAFATAGHTHAASAITFTPTGGIVATNVQAAIAELGVDIDNTLTNVINVKNYGAVGDGVADDTAAINSAITAFKAAVYAPTGTVGFLKARLVFPPGVYKVAGSLNFQSIQRMGWTVVCTGAIIHGTGSGKTVIDLLGSRGGSFVDLTLVGDNSTPPAIGVQTGRFVGSTAADNMTYYRPVFDGKFTRSCVYNLAAEIDTYVAPVFRNTEPSGCAIIYDGCNHYGAITDYTAPTAPADTVMSNIQHTHLSGTYGCGNSDRAVEITSGSQFRFIDGTAYAKPAANGEACAFLINAIAGVSGFVDLDLDVHQELCSVHTLINRSASGSLNITGLKIRDIMPQATDALIKAGTGVTLTLKQSVINTFNYTGNLTSGSVTFTDANINGVPFNLSPPLMTYPAPTTGYYSTWAGQVSSSSAFAAINTIYLYPVYIPSPRTIKTLVMRVSTGGAGSSIKVGVWANSPVSNRPLGAPLIVDNTGLASTSSSTTLEFNTADVLLPAGWYWFGSKTTGTPPAMWSIATNSAMGFTFMPAASASVIFSTGFSFADTYSNNMPTFAEGASFTLSSATIPIIDYSI